MWLVLVGGGGLPSRCSGMVKGRAARGAQAGGGVTVEGAGLAVREGTEHVKGGSCERGTGPGLGGRPGGAGPPDPRPLSRGCLGSWAGGLEGSGSASDVLVRPLPGWLTCPLLSGLRPGARVVFRAAWG